MRMIGAQEKLLIGTPVQVKNKCGRVLFATEQPGSGNSGGKVFVHTIEFDEVYRRGFGNRGRWVKLAKKIVAEVNYSFIEKL